MGNTTERDIQRAIALSDMCQLLSMSLHLPTQEIAAGLLDGSLAEDVFAIFNELDFPVDMIEKFRPNFLKIQSSKQTKEELLLEMRQEYTRLFTHPKKPQIAIYETLFRHDPEKDNGEPSLFISPAALDAERCYIKAGLVMSKEINEPGDHMATEMEFMMYLYLQKAKALQENNQDEVARRDAEIKEFSELHLQRWAIEFFNHCMETSNSEVYRIFGDIGSTFMSEMLVQ